MKKQLTTFLTLALVTLFMATSARAQATDATTTALVTNQPNKDLGEFKIKVPANLLPSITKPAESATDDNPTAPAAPAQTQTSQPSRFSDRTISRDRNAPRRESLQAIKIVKHVNALLNGFEQSAGFGAGVELTTADSIPGVEIYGRALTSTRLYRRFDVGGIVGNENTRGEVWFSYLRRTHDRFHGIGPRTSELTETDFSVEQRSYNALISHRFAPKLDTGLYVRLSNTGSFDGEDDALPPITVLFTGNPAVVPLTRYAPGLNNNVKLLSYGGFVEFDARDNSVGLTKGGFFYGRIGSVEGLKNGNRFSDYGWNEVELDGRAYVPIFSDKTSVALRLYTVLKDPKRGSQIPFYEQAFFGGRSFGRGFRSYRFRADNSLLLSGELRQTVYTQSEHKGVDLVAFVDAGQVWGDNRSRTNPLILPNDDFRSANWRIGAGGGVQYRLSSKLAFRFDVGASNERTAAYFSLSRGF